MITIESLSKSFNPKEPPALNNINATVPEGVIVGLVGPDGAGKTTLIRLIAGLLKPTSGKITVAGFDTVTDQDRIAEILGYMPQKFGLYEDLSVSQNLNLYANLQGILGKEKDTAIESLLSFTELTPFLNRLAKDLSGGMKQKLGLACTLIRKPKILLLDEPSVGVDPISRRELWKMVHELLPQGISVVWSTAYLDEAERCSKVLLLNEGNLLYEGTPDDLCNKVQGRVFKISGIQGSKRAILSKVLNDENIVDGVIQGKDLRIVVKDPNISLKFGHLTVEAASPRFEDAFIDLLGGSPKGMSRLAELTPSFTLKDPIVVNAKGLTKKFGSFTAADQISFEIKQGEIFGLLGPNGAGKSTTFKMLCGLLSPTSGKASVLEYDLQAAPSIARSHVGYMAQKFSLYGDLSVLQNLSFFSGIYNLKGSAKEKAIHQMIEIFHFKQYLEHSAQTLPLGLKQRLALACAAMHQPEILFLDEPTSGVDPITRREFWNHINGLIEKGVTVMVTTHFMDEAEYCDRIALIYKSRMITIGTPEELKEKAATKEHPYPTLEDAFIKLIEAYDQTR